MKQVLNGFNVNTTALVLAWLQGQGPFYLTELFQIGDFDNPNALLLTSWASPLLWTQHGTFLNATIERDKVDMKIGLEVATLDVKWTPPYQAYTKSLATAGAYQRAAIGDYKDWPLRVWTCYMPTPGDADTYGCSELFGGRIGPTKVERGAITFTVNSFLDIINNDIPAQVVEITNPLAATAGATPPSGLSQVPQFGIVVGSTANMLICDCTSPTPHQIFDDDVLRNGFLVFNSGAGATLGRQWSGIQSNKKLTISGVDYNQIQLYKLLPFAPTPGGDTIYVSAAAPINLADGNYQGFPYVPDPESGV